MNVDTFKTALGFIGTGTGLGISFIHCLTDWLQLLAALGAVIIAVITIWDKIKRKKKNDSTT
jgi:uncharacterized membrane protein YgaE (UPF0421/DUF939 family)